MSNEKILAMRGLPASGKSTIAEKLVLCEEYCRVNKDLLREMLHFNKWSNKREDITRKVQKAIIKVLVDSGQKVVIDNTNLSKSQVAECKEASDMVRGSFEWIDMTDVDVMECIARDEKRPNRVGRDVILKMWNDYIRPDESYPFSPGLRECLICDIDGTIAEMCDRSPYDYEKAIGDKVRVHVAEIVHMNLLRGVQPIFLSGRDSKCRDVTERWLKERVGIYPVTPKSELPDGYLLYMRKEGDNRADYIVKTELFNDHIRDKWNVSLVMDDREQVVYGTWSKLGLDDRLLRCGRVFADNF
jgi:predicted kinase